MLNWPIPLISEIARRRSVIFFGAGISMQCQNIHGQKPKGWSDLLSTAVDGLAGAEARREEIRRLIRDREYLTACEVIRERMGEHPFHEFVRGELLTPNFQPAPIHDSLIQLGSRIYATPNFDKIFENRLSALPDNPVLVKNYYDDDIGVVAKGTTPVVLKVHGTIDAPDKLIFTRADYTRARNQYWRFYTVLESLSITHTFLFVGCGLSDPDLKLVLEDHAFTYRWTAPHYFVMRKRTVPASILPAIERNLNIKVLEYDGDHSELKPALDNLVAAVNDRRKEIQLERTW